MCCYPNVECCLLTANAFLFGSSGTLYIYKYNQVPTNCIHLFDGTTFFFLQYRHTCRYYNAMYFFVRLSFNPCIDSRHCFLGLFSLYPVYELNMQSTGSSTLVDILCVYRGDGGVFFYYHVFWLCILLFCLNKNVCFCLTFAFFFNKFMGYIQP